MVTWLERLIFTRYLLRAHHRLRACCFIGLPVSEDSSTKEGVWLWLLFTDVLAISLSVQPKFACAVHACTCMYTFMGEHARVFLWRQDDRCLLFYLTFKLRDRVSHWTWSSVIWEDNSATKLQGASCLPLRGETSVMHNCTAPFTGMLGIWTRVLVFAQFIRRAISLAPQPAPLIWAQVQVLSNLWLTASPPATHAKRLSVWVGLSLMTGFDFWVARQKYIENSKSIDPGPRVKRQDESERGKGFNLLSHGACAEWVASTVFTGLCSSVWSWEPGLVRPGVDRVLEKLQWGQKVKQWIREEKEGLKFLKARKQSFPWEGYLNIFCEWAD